MPKTFFRRALVWFVALGARHRGLLFTQSLNPRSYFDTASIPRCNAERTVVLYTTSGYGGIEDDVGIVEDFEDEEDGPASLSASPVSQVQRNDNHKLYGGSYLRGENWLEQATEDVLNTDGRFRLGALTEDDVETIVSLMAAWVGRRSVHAALVVERLLKRVVDDMKAGNSDIHVTSRVYTIAIDAWGKSGSPGGAQRAQQIHGNMINVYRETKDRIIAPSVMSYNALMNAWCRGPSSEALDEAESILAEMIDSDTPETAPNAVSFSTLIDAYARSNATHATRRAEELFEMMADLGVKRDVYTFRALQNAFARSGKRDGPERTMEVLNQMLELYDKGDVFAKPDCKNYNTVLFAYSRTPCKNSASLANAMLEKMELSVDDGGYDVEPNRLSYALTILACGRCPDPRTGSELAESNLEKMERRAKDEAKKRNEVSSAAPPAVTLDIECFNVALTAISSSREPDAVERMIAIIQRMKDYSKEDATSRIHPTVRSWNAVLNALSRSGEKDSAEKAERILNHMFELHEQGVAGVKPNAFSFNAVLSAYQRLGGPASVKRANEFLQYMENLYSLGELDDPPDVYHCTIVCAAWARSDLPEAPERCIEILTQLHERHAAGQSGVKPNVRTYNAVLDCLSRASEAEKAEQLLYYMLALAKNGDKDARPDGFSFSSVVNAFTSSKLKDAGRRAESVLDRYLEYAEENPWCKPDRRAFTNIIGYYARSKTMMDAPYRAEYVLNRCVGLFKSGEATLSPNVYAFTAVMDSYSLHNHPDAGECAERLLRLMYTLRDKYSATTLEINTGVMNCVLNAWASCGDDNAGHRAEKLLEKMEEKCLEGISDMRPNSRSYCLVVGAWAKSSCMNKGVMARRVLDQMKQRYKEGVLHVRPGERPHGLVINACGFTNGSADAESQAFKIAVKTMTEMMESEEFEISSTSYGWFLQACGRLCPYEKIRDENVGRAFMKCLESGLVNKFVFHHFRIAASNDLFWKILSPAVNIQGRKVDTEDEEMKYKLSLSDLPNDWTQKGRPSKRRGQD